MRSRHREGARRRLPGASFSGHERVAKGVCGVFLCYALPALASTILGIIARGRSVLATVFLSAATPTADNDVPAMKLAEAEKHIAVIPSSDMQT